MLTCDVFMFIKYKTASSRVKLVKSILFTLNILSPINNPDFDAILFDWISQINSPYLFPPAKRMPILDVSVANETYRIPGLNFIEVISKEFFFCDELPRSKIILSRVFLRFGVKNNLTFAFIDQFLSFIEWQMFDGYFVDLNRLILQLNRIEKRCSTCRIWSPSWRFNSLNFDESFFI